MSLVLGLGLERSCPWPREVLSSKRLSLALASDFFLCPWPWPRALCPRLHLWDLKKILYRYIEVAEHLDSKLDIKFKAVVETGVSETVVSLSKRYC